jgi:hypothetical protein
VLNNLERLDHILRIYLRDDLRSPVPEQKPTFYFHSQIDGFDAIAPPHRAVGVYNSCPLAVQAFGMGQGLAPAPGPRRRRARRGG